MNAFDDRTRRTRRTTLQALPAMAALLASLGSFALLLAGFDAASPRRWLPAQPETLALVARCDALGQRAERDACAKQVVTLRLQRLHAGPLLAQR